MTLSKDILLIEDNPEHVNAIKEFLDASGFEVTSLQSNNDLEITNYKARKNYFIIIVDEILDGLETTSGLQLSGFHLIIDKLIKLDRTTPYVLFSREPQSHRISQEHAMPAIKFIQKSFLANALSEECLQDLRNAVSAYQQYQIPTFRIPDYLSMRQNMETEICQFAWDDQDAQRELIDSLDQSGNLVNDIATFSSTLGRIGASSENITVGVFGSYGRFEARPISDIEFSVLFDGDNEEIALSAWNRIYRYCREVINKEVEGQQEIGELLTSEYVKASKATLSSGSIPLNSYSPIYPPRDILPSEIQQMYPHLLFRMYQILAEMSPVFNQEKMDSIKASVLGFEVGDHSNAIEVLLSEKMKEICETFFTFVQPVDSMGLDKVVKSTTFRTLGVLAFRTSIIRIAKFERSMPKTKGGVSRMFQELCAPPVIKLLRMRRSLQDGKKDKNLTLILSCYAMVFQKMSKGTPKSTDLRALSEALSAFINFFNEVRDICDEFGEMGKWVFNTDEIASLQKKILAIL